MALNEMNGQNPGVELQHNPAPPEEVMMDRIDYMDEIHDQICAHEKEADEIVGKIFFSALYFIVVMNIILYTLSPKTVSDLTFFRSAVLLFLVLNVSFVSLQGNAQGSHRNEARTLRGYYRELSSPTELAHLKAEQLAFTEELPPPAMGDSSCLLMLLGSAVFSCLVMLC